MRVSDVWSGSDPQIMPESSDPRLVKSSRFLLSLSFPPSVSFSTFSFLVAGTSADPAPLPSSTVPLLRLQLLLLVLLLLLLLSVLLVPPAQLVPRVMAGVLVGFVDEDWMILVHIVAPRMELVHKVFSDSALGEDTSTSGIRCRALSKLRLRWCWVMLIRVLVTCDTGGNRIPIDLKSKLRFLWCVDRRVFWGSPFALPAAVPLPAVRPCTEGIVALLLLLLMLPLPPLQLPVSPRLLLRLSLGLWKRLLALTTLH